MVRPSVSQAKNRMRRAVDYVLDPTPRSVDELWNYFGSVCAYCGTNLDRTARSAHVDHAVVGGGNQLGNLILSCGSCNGDEKREESWREFLARKVVDPDVRAARKRRIEEWFALHAVDPYVPSQDVVRARAEAEAFIEAFGAKCAELRLLVADDRRRQQG